MNSIHALRKVIEMVQSDKITVVKSDLSKNYTNKELAELSLAQLCNIYRAKDFMTLLGYEIMEGGTDKSLLIEVDRALFERLEMEREGGRVSDDFVGYVQAILTEGTEFANKAKINMGIENYTISNIEDRTCNMKGRDYYDNTGRFEAFINLFVSKSANDAIIRNKPITLENFKKSENTNFSGRCCHRKISAEEIANEVVLNFEKAITPVEKEEAFKVKLPFAWIWMGCPCSSNSSIVNNLPGCRVALISKSVFTPACLNDWVKVAKIPIFCRLERNSIFTIPVGALFKYSWIGI